MRRIPFTQAVVLTGADREAVASDFLAAAQALEDSAQVSMGLLKDWMASEAKVREYAKMIVTQSEGAQQIMQINLLLSGALGKIREGADVDETVESLSAQLAEFGGDDAPA